MPDEHPRPSPFKREIAVVRDGFATSFNRLESYRGCLYRPDGSKLALSERFFRTANPEQVDPAVAAAAPRLSGRTLYLGQYMEHYGHFLTETLSTFWIFETRPPDAFDRVVFHPGFTGWRITSFARHCFACFGIDADRVILLGDGPVRFEEVVVPEQLFRLYDAADPALRQVFGRIRDATLAGRAVEPARDIYLSRRRTYFRLDVPPPGARIAANEVHIEALFRSRGFAVVYPETLAFPDQVALYAQARTLAGLTGSALHNSLFQRPGSRLIELEHPGHPENSGVVRNQDLCNAVAGVDGVRVPFRGRARHRGQVARYDLAHVAAQLARHVTAAPTPATADRRLAAALEVRALEFVPPVQAGTRRLRRATRLLRRVPSRAVARLTALLRTLTGRAAA